MMLAEAGGTLGAWIQSWTEPGDEERAAGHPQRRVRLLDGTDEAAGRLIVKVEGAPHTGEPDREFEVVVVVRERVS
jgi:hypothetical protein